MILSAAFVMLLDYIYIYKQRAGKEECCNLLAKLPVVPRWISFLCMTAVLLVCGMFGSSSFIYFNF